MRLFGIAHACVVLLTTLFQAAEAQRDVPFINEFPKTYTVLDDNHKPAFGALLELLTESDCQKYTIADLDTSNKTPKPTISVIEGEQPLIDIAWKIYGGEYGRHFFLLSVKLKYMEEKFRVTNHNRRCILVSLKSISKQHGPVVFHLTEISANGVKNAVLDVDLRAGSVCKVGSILARQPCFPVQKTSTSENINNMMETTTLYYVFNDFKTVPDLQTVTSIKSTTRKSSHEKEIDHWLIVTLGFGLFIIASCVSAVFCVFKLHERSRSTESHPSHTIEHGSTHLYTAVSTSSDVPCQNIPSSTMTVS